MIELLDLLIFDLGSDSQHASFRRIIADDVLVSKGVSACMYSLGGRIQRCL